MTESDARKKVLVNVALLAFGIVVLGLVALQVQKYLAAKDSGALFGGKLESAYPATAYLLSTGADQVTQQCTAVFVGSGTALTAAHCVHDRDQVFVGLANFDVGDTLETLGYQFYPGWERNKMPAFDTVKLDVPFAATTPSDLAVVASPEVGCGYAVVAYGRNDEGIRGLRKSADFCIEKLDQNTFTLKSPEASICFGDSGSPIFKKGTNVVVGLISQISDGNNNPCDSEDQVTATRLDTKRDFISGLQVGTKGQLAVSPASSGLNVSSVFTSLDSGSVAIIVTGVVAVLLVTIGLVLLKNRGSKAEESESGYVM